VPYGIDTLRKVLNHPLVGAHQRLARLPNVSSRRVRVRVGVTAAAAAILALGGCAAGQHAQTAEETPVVDGVAADAGPMALRAVTVSPPLSGSYPKGGNAPLQLVIANDSRIDDRLVRVTTPVAGEVRMFANSTTATSAAGALESLSFPRGQATSIGFADSEPAIQLQNLTQQLFPAQSFPITFQFASAGSVTFSIAVHLVPGPSSTPTINVAPTVES
jgi:copper(I)-binding protein